ncbi:unnamed protein product [Rotaria sordida]|uniref:WASH complex subunit FAM21 n=1 Tax=Rotaria sordida TaxID=392033 RepID=A0A815K9B8_9BILA|nr:unnamed protein product [Rotaria sordida]
MDVQLPPPPPPPPPSFLTETTTSQLTVPPPPAPSLPPPESVITTTTTTTTVATPSVQDRIWLHPWTVTEMREHASQWSLAGDAGLLLYLEQFSGKLAQRADAIQQHLNQTVNAVKSTHTRVQNCLNEFTSLANTQFIENRVYDEDETVNAKTSKKDEQSTEKTNVSNSEAQEKVLQRYVEAIQYGLTILDTHFERVDAKLDNIQNGISSIDDDEDVGVPIEPILEPKDPYIFRPLPYLIGTSEFMQDDFVGLADLLNIHDEDTYDVEQIEKIESDSALSSSDQEDEDFQVQVSSVPIVPAGASRPDIANRSATTVLTDSEDENDLFGMNTGPKFDDFSSKKPVYNDISEEPTKSKKVDSFHELDNEDDIMFGIPVKKPQPIIETNNNNNNENFDNESLTSKESNEPEEQQKHIGGISMFGSAQKGMSELEKAVLRRRKTMGEPDVSSIDEDDEIKKPKKTSNEPISSIVTKIPTERSSSTISNLTSQPLTKPTTTTTTEKISKSSIFGENIPADDEDEDEIFSDAPKLKPLSSIVPSSSKTIVDTKPSIIIPSKKEKDIFDNDTDEDDDPFAIKKKDTSSSLSIKKNDTNSKIQSQTTTKPKPVIPPVESDDDDLFGTKKTQPKPIPTISKTSTIEKTKSPSSDDDLFNTSTITKTQPPPAKISEDEDSLFARKPPVQQPIAPIVPASAPVSTPSIKKLAIVTDEDSDDEIFGISKTKPKVPTTEKQNSVSSTKPDDNNNLLGKSTTTSKVVTAETPKVIPSMKSNDDDELFGASKTKPKIPTTEVQKVSSPIKTDDDEDDLFGKLTIKPKLSTKDTQKVIPPTKSNDNDKSLTKPKIAVTKDDDEDDELFSSPKPSQVKSPAATVSSPLPSTTTTTTVKTDTYEDPLTGIRKPIETTSQPPIKTPIVQPVKKSISDSDEDELFPKRQVNTAALKEGEKPNVKALSSLLNINPNAHRPGARPKTHSFIEEQSKPSVVNDDQPSQTIEPSQTVVKKLSKLDSDSDDDLFSNKKKEKATVSNTEQKDKTNVEDEKVNVKALSSRIKINPMTHMPGTQPKPISNEENGSNNVVQTTSTETSKEEPIADKTMLNILKDRAKVSVKTRAPPTRKPRSTGATTAAMANADEDDLFALPSSNKTATSSSSTTSPVIPSQSDIPSPVSITGLPDNTAAIAAISDKQTNSKEKKTFSLFDSDDSDIDELLFGFSKKNKSSITSKPTTTPSTTTKSNILSLDDDDDNDFLSKRPIKKSTKPIDDDDIFADVKIKSQQTNKAKKDWSIMNKTVTDDTDDIFNDGSTKSSTTSKSKSTNVKNKSIKDLDDIFDDPFNVSSKR